MPYRDAVQDAQSLRRQVIKTFGYIKMSLNHISKYTELTDNQFEKIGKVVVEWSNVEFLQKQLLYRLLLTPEFMGRTYTDLISAAKIQDAIREAVEHHRIRYGCKIIKEEQLVKITVTNEKVAKARANRNKFAHFCWLRSTDDEIFGTRFSAGLPDSKKHKKGSLSIKTAEIDALYKESYELVENLNRIIEELPEVGEEELLRNIIVKQED